MNIFILDYNIKKCARYHCDKHVIKMLLEYAQILCTVSNLQGMKTPYRSTHINHPCVKWATKSIQNWRWLKKLALELNREYQYRYGEKKDHASAQVIKKLSEPKLPNIGLTEFVQAMPKKIQIENDPVRAYRNYYLQMKRPFATWKKRGSPEWWTGYKNV